MSDQTTDAADRTESTVPSQAPTWIGGAGLVLVALGLFAAVSLFTEMGSDDGFSDLSYSTVDKWLAVLAATVVTGLGLVTVALAVVISRLPERR